MQIEKIEQARRTYHDDWISGGAVKTMLDGVIEAHTAAMLEPYSDDPTQIGKLFWDPAKYKQAVTELDRRGLQIFTHAIGDRAVRLALDAYQKRGRNQSHSAMRVPASSTSRPSARRIFRASANWESLPAFSRCTPIRTTTRSKVWARNAGPERAQRAWVWHSIESTGGVLAFGSDWPVVTLNPWPGVQNALDPADPEGDPPGGFVPQERISLEDAIKAYTLGAAFAGHREKTEGSLEPGKLADLIVLSQDLFKIEPSKIAKTEVLLTMVGGKVVYQAPEWPATRQQRR